MLRCRFEFADHLDTSSSCWEGYKRSPSSAPELSLDGDEASCYRCSMGPKPHCGLSLQRIGCRATTAHDQGVNVVRPPAPLSLSPPLAAPADERSNSQH